MQLPSITPKKLSNLKMQQISQAFFPGIIKNDLQPFLQLKSLLAYQTRTIDPCGIIRKLPQPGTL